jgi:hypothetical protein
MYTDEGSNSYIITNNDYLSNGNWYAPNQGCPTCGVNNANNTLENNFGHVAGDEVNFPNRTGNFNDTFIDNLNVPSLAVTSEEGQRVGYRAGVLPGRRGSRPVSNPETPDSYLSLAFSSLSGGRVQVTATLSNFDDVEFTHVSFDQAVTGATKYKLTSTGQVPRSIPANGASAVKWELEASRPSKTCTGAPTVSVTAKYTNPRTGKSETISATGTVPGMQALPSDLSTSATWPGTSAGEVCSQSGNTLLSIRSGGRDVFSPYDDWTAIYQSSSIAESGSVTSQVLSLDAASSGTKAGVVVRNSLASNGNYDAVVSTGYAGVFVTPANGVTFSWDASGDGRLDTQSTVSGVKAPLWVRLVVNGTQFSGYYSSDGNQWTQIGSAVALASREQTSDAGILVSSLAGFTNATGVFGGLAFA